MIYHELLALLSAGQPCALATLVSTSGSSPQNAGAKVIFLPNGRIIGTIGGGCLEAEARRIGLDAIRSRQCRLFELRLDDDFGWDDGLICGGRVQIFINPNPGGSADAYRSALELSGKGSPVVIETIIRGAEREVGNTRVLRPDSPEAMRDASDELRKGLDLAIETGRERVVELPDGSAVYLEPILPRPTLLIAGAGHVGAALGQIAAMCGFAVVMVDDRPDFANRERLPFADHVEAGDIPAFLRNYPIGPGTYVVIVTRGHRHDAHCLRECVRSSARYVGMIGSRRKICVIFEEMLRDGLATPEELARVHSPLGLEIGAREVGEIAVSIAAELVAVRRGIDPATVHSMKYTPPFVKPYVKPYVLQEDR